MVDPLLFMKESILFCIFCIQFDLGISNPWVLFVTGSVVHFHLIGSFRQEIG